MIVRTYAHHGLAPDSPHWQIDPMTDVRTYVPVLSDDGLPVLYGSETLEVLDTDDYENDEPPAL